MSTGARVSPALLALVTLLVGACASGNAERARREAEATDLRARLEALQKSHDAQEREIAKLAEQLKAVDAQQAFLVAEAKESKAGLARVQKALEPARRAPAAPPAPGGRAAAPSAPGATSADSVFAAAMARFRAEEYGQAALEFAAVIDTFPRHSLAPIAQYWIGEAYYRQGDYRHALAEFLKVVGGYPVSPQVPEALLKIGLCHRGLEDTARARESWELLAKDYPATSAGTEARTLLSELQGAARRSR
jgi:tol-pal system protein YbgF